MLHLTWLLAELHSTVLPKNPMLASRHDGRCLFSTSTDSKPLGNWPSGGSYCTERITYLLPALYCIQYALLWRSCSGIIHEQCQVMNTWYLLPLQAFCFNDMGTFRRRKPLIQQRAQCGFFMTLSPTLLATLTFILETFKTTTVTSPSFTVRMLHRYRI